MNITRIGVLCLALGAAVNAASGEDAGSPGTAAPDDSQEVIPNRASTEDGYDFQWLDPDKKIHVLQNRRYLKTGHVMLSALFGATLTTPYRNVYGFEPRLAYYFSEAWGIEGFYAVKFNSHNSTYEALTNASPDTLPVVREYRSQAGGLVHWSPWYAKINVFNTIIYFDWYLSGGLGVLRSEIDTNRRVGQEPTFVEENATGIFLGTGHLFHLSDMWVARLDMTSVHYRAPLLGTSGEDTWFSDYTFNAGLGIRF